MPYIIVSGWYPTHIVKEATDAYMEVLKQMPFDRSLGKETIQVAVSSGRNGIKFHSVNFNRKEITMYVRNLRKGRF